MWFHILAWETSGYSDKILKPKLSNKQGKTNNAL